VGQRERHPVALGQQATTALSKREQLRPAMRLGRHILSERCRPYEWMLEPLYSLRGKIGE